MHVFASVWTSLTNKGITGTEREKRAFMSANSVLNKRFLKPDNKDSHNDRFNHKVNLFLGNIK